MPDRTVYVKQEDEYLWENLRGGDSSVAEQFAEFLRIKNGEKQDRKRRKPNPPKVTQLVVMPGSIANPPKVFVLLSDGKVLQHGEDHLWWDITPSQTQEPTAAEPSGTSA